MKKLWIALMLLCLCWVVYGRAIHTDFLKKGCIKALSNDVYRVCDEIIFKINESLYFIPKDFETTFPTVRKIFNFNPEDPSQAIAFLVHDWLYRMTCDFTRKDSDIILYSILVDQGVSKIKSSLMYYGVRVLSKSVYSEDYCEYDFREGMDKSA